MHSCLFILTNTATPEIYTLSLHDALPISAVVSVAFMDVSPFGCVRSGCVEKRGTVGHGSQQRRQRRGDQQSGTDGGKDRKSTRLNSSHMSISYAVFCLKKKKR